MFISEKIRSDLIEIEERIKQLKILDVDGVEEYTRKSIVIFHSLIRMHGIKLYLLQILNLLHIYLNLKPLTIIHVKTTEV